MLLQSINKKTGTAVYVNADYRVLILNGDTVWTDIVANDFSDAVDVAFGQLELLELELSKK